MKISARNQIAGRVTAIQPGAVNGSVWASDVLIGK